MQFNLEQILFALLLAGEIGTGYAILSINERLCHSDKTSIAVVVKLFQNNFSYKDAPKWAKKQYRRIDCSKKGINFIPTQVIPKNTEYLDMSFNRLRVISSTDLNGLENLTILNLKMNCVPSKYIITSLASHANCESDLYIEPGALENLQNLRILLLNNNYLREFPSRLPVSLLCLNIDHTWLGDITAPLVENNLKLKIVSAGGNCRLVAVAPTGPRCPRHFNISSNFSEYLETLFLYFNAWTVVPSYLIQKKLKILQLTANVISRIRKNDFVKGKNLKELYLNGLSSTKTESYVTIENNAFDYLVELEVLSLANNFLKFIQNDLFRRNTKLKYLDLARNSLFESVITNAPYLAHLASLQYLDVSGNAEGRTVRLNEMRLGASYANLTSLETLAIGFISPLQRSYFFSSMSVQFNSISEQSIDLLASLKHLRVLCVYGISLNWLNPSLLQKLNHLEYFDAANNEIQFRSHEVEESFYTDTSEQLSTRLKQTLRQNTDNGKGYSKKRYMLTSLNLSNDCITTKVLNLSNNFISNLTNRMNFLNQACTVDLSFNKIRQINNNDIESFATLKVLILDHNPLHEIDPYALSGMTQLQTLSMHDVLLNPVKLCMGQISLTFLYYLPNATHITLKWKDGGIAVSLAFILWFEVYAQESAYFDSISVLDLSGNKLVGDLSVITFFCQQVAEIIVRDSQLYDAMLSQPLLPPNNKLTLLDLGSNHLLLLPMRQAIENLNNLQFLVLDHNKIFELSGNILFNLTSLEKLDLSHNKISYIQARFFSRSKLKYLDLSYNEIARLGNDVFSLEVLSNLEQFDVRGNEIDCSCGVWNVFRSWLALPEAQHVTIQGFVPKCSSDLDLFYGGCVACHSPFDLKDTSLLWYIAHPSCEVSVLSMYTAVFSSFSLLFLLFGTLGYSKWIERIVFRKVNQQFRVRSLQNQPAVLPNTAQNNVFVVFDYESNEVGDWVDHRLCRAMEEGVPRIPLKVHGKDVSCGAAPSQQLIRNIINCRKTIVFLSYDFFSKKTCW